MRHSIFTCLMVAATATIGAQRTPASGAGVAPTVDENRSIVSWKSSGLFFAASPRTFACPLLPDAAAAVQRGQIGNVQSMHS